LLEAITLADEVGPRCVWHRRTHRREFLDSAPAMILRRRRNPNPKYTPNERCHSPERGRPGARFQESRRLIYFRTEGRRSSPARLIIEAFPLFGLELEDYDSALCRETRSASEHPREHVRSLVGKHRPELTGQGVTPTTTKTRCRFGSVSEHAQLFYFAPAFLGSINGRHHRRPNRTVFGR